METTKKITKKPVADTELQARIFDIEGSEVGKKSLEKSIFGLPNNPKLIAQYIYVYLQNQRKGTASTLTRAEVNATTKKVYRQKGTGGARHGSLRAPIYVGGGVAGGPKPKDFSKLLNKQQKKLALKIALSLKASAQHILLLDGDHAEMKPSTKILSTFFKKSNIQDQSTLVVLGAVKKNGLILSLRNLPGVDITSAHTLNAYDVLNHSNILFVHEGLDVINKQYTA